MSTWSDLKNNPRLKKTYADRLAIIRYLREWFWENDFVETDTPIAVRYPGQEPYLNPVKITLQDPWNQNYDFFLHTSPEFAMKKLLAAGWSKIFQLAHCFRNSESFGGTHNPEFVMLEWYRAPGSLKDIMDDTENIFKFIGGKMQIEKLRYQNKTIEYLLPWERITMKEVWQKFLGVNLDDYLTRENLAVLTEKIGLSVEKNDAYEDLFFKIFLNKIEDKLGEEKPVFIYNYPLQMSSLSRPCAHDPRYAERFELYVGGLELANAFGELTDAVDQKNRLEKDRELRQYFKKDIWEVDSDFIGALQSGVPNPENLNGQKSTAGGIALGVDRMVLLFTGAHDLNEVIFQSVSDQLIF